MTIRYTSHKGRTVAAHAEGPVDGTAEQQRDRRRSPDHVSNVRRKQREAKRAIHALFA